MKLRRYSPLAYRVACGECDYWRRPEPIHSARITLKVHEKESTHVAAVYGAKPVEIPLFVLNAR